MSFMANKQLVQAVSMALCGGIAFTVAPQVVYAADTTYAGFWFTEDGNYGTWGKGEKNSWGSTLAEVVSDVYANATAEAPIVLNVVNSASADGSDFTTKTGKSFGELLGADSVTLPAGSGISISDGEGNSVVLTAQTATTLSGATSTTTGTLVYDGVQVQAADGTLAKVEISNVTVTTTGTLKATEIDVKGTATLTSSGATTLAADTLVLDSAAASSLNSSYTLTSASGGTLVLKDSSGKALDDTTFQSLLAYVPSTVTVTNNDTKDESGNVATYQGTQASTTNNSGSSSGSGGSSSSGGSSESGGSSSSGESGGSSSTTTTVTPDDATAVHQAEVLGYAMVYQAMSIDTTALSAADARALNLSADLFQSTLPQKTDLAVAKQLDAYATAKAAYEKALAALSTNDQDIVSQAVTGTSTSTTSTETAVASLLSASLLATTSTTTTTTTTSTTDPTSSLSGSGLTSTSGSYATDLETAMQTAGRTTLAPVVGGSRAAALIDDVTQANVVRRTEVLRNRPPKTVRPLDAKDPQQASDNIWVGLHHSRVDVGKDDYVSKTTVDLNNYQLGYDTKLGTKDYVGAFIGMSNGNASFTSYSASTTDGQVELTHAIDGGLYGTHIYPRGRYVDYLVHYGRFDNKYQDAQFSTCAVSAMLLGGWTKKLPHGTVNPYVAVTGSKITTGDYNWSGNTIKTQPQKNYAVKVGLDYAYNGGVFGGIAYSRGLSGEIQSTLNGFALPTLDYDTQVLYLKLGYRGKLSQHLAFDLLAQEYLLDYKGWTVNGKLELGF